MPHLPCSLLVALIWLLCLGGSNDAWADRRVALVIGNSQYQNTPVLPNPRNDAEDVAAGLRAVGFEVILKSDLNKRDMDSALGQFARAARDADAALFYYTGHGMQFRGGNYLMPVDASLEDEISLQYEMVPVEQVLTALNSASVGVKILILDACRNNPLADHLAKSIAPRFRDVGTVRGLAPIERARGMVVAYATQADEVAQDGQGRNSPFSQAFIDNIREPGVEIGTMFRRIANVVYTRTGGKQIPELSISLLSEFYLNPGETDRDAWMKARIADDSDALRTFIQHYPSSRYVVDAKSRLDELASAKLENDNRQKLENERAAAKLAEFQRKQRELDEALQREADLRARLKTQEAERGEALAQALAELARLHQEAANPPQLAKAQAEIERLRAEIDKARAQETAEQQQTAEERAKAAAEIERLRVEEELRKASAAANPKEAMPGGSIGANTVAVAAPQATLVVSAPAPPKAPLDGTLVRSIKFELKRIGCYNANLDSDWGSTQTIRAVATYAKQASITPIPELPNQQLLEDLRGRKEGLCPLVCSAREVERSGKCVAKSCPQGEVLGRAGNCIAKPKPVAQVKASPVQQHAPASAPAGASRCFSFQGKQYCE